MSSAAKIARTLRDRPLKLLSIVRMYVLFYLTRFLRILIPLPGITFGSNVRLQRVRCVFAEKPDALISIGEHSIIYEDTKLEAFGKGLITIGARSILGGARVVSRYQIQIGERFLSSWNVFIQDFDPHPSDPALRKIQLEQMTSNFRPAFDGGAPALTGDLGEWNFPGESIHIGDDVWIGANVTILKGVTIGSGCIVASGAVVLRGTYPVGSLIAGNPATVVKSILTP